MLFRKLNPTIAMKFLKQSKYYYELRADNFAITSSYTYKNHCIGYIINNLSIWCFWRYKHMVMRMGLEVIGNYILEMYSIIGSRYRMSLYQYAIKPNDPWHGLSANHRYTIREYMDYPTSDETSRTIKRWFARGIIA